MEKQNTYFDKEIEEADELPEKARGRLINLNMNYRSRAEVLNAVNYIFEKIMTPDFGGISYDEGAKLHTPDKDAYETLYPEMNSENYEEGVQVADFPQLTLIERDSDAEDLTYDEAEAVLIGQKIRLIVEGDPKNNIKPLYVRNEAYNPDRGESKHNLMYRPARYGDIVILMRALTSITPMIRVFEQMGLPIQVEDSKGYFDAMEIMTVVSTLRVIDNDEQDIPFASMLLSHIGGMTDSDLAIIVSHSDQGKVSLAEKCRRFEEGYLERADEPELREIAKKLHLVRTYLEAWITPPVYNSI